MAAQLISDKVSFGSLASLVLLGAGIIAGKVIAEMVGVSSLFETLAVSVPAATAVYAGGSHVYAALTPDKKQDTPSNGVLQKPAREPSIERAQAPGLMQEIAPQHSSTHFQDMVRQPSQERAVYK